MAKKKSKKQVIGVDLDDVLMDFNDALQDYHNKKFGTKVLRQQLINYDIYPKVWGCTPHEAALRACEFYSTAEHAAALPIKGSTEALSRLRDRYDMHIISSRPKQVMDVTTDWVSRNFPGHFKSLNLTNQYYGKGKIRTKAEVCKDLGVSIMVEDSMSHAKELSHIGINVFLLDCPWNQGEVPENVMRVYSWKEIVEHLER